MEAEPRFSYDAASQGQRLDFAAERPGIMTMAFTLLWLTGWVFMLVLTALSYLRFRDLNVVPIVALVVGGVPVALALWWAASGKRESLIVTSSELRITRWAGPIRLTRSVSAATIVGLRAVAVPRHPLSDLYAVRKLYGAGHGSLIVDTAARALSVGHTIQADTASRVIDQLRQYSRS